jgi:nucleoside-diphosphate-sugar epimerase
MSLFVVVGAGPVGRETSRLLAAEGNEVRIASRSGLAIPGFGIDGVALDARNGRELARLSDGADAIFMCAMAPYTSWPTDFPPIMNGVVSAARDVSARLVVLGNTYGYGERAEVPLNPSSPLFPTSVKGHVRAAMWEQTLASGVPAIEVRASDYLGQEAVSLFTLMVLPALIAGQPIAVPGDLDASHAWSFTKDVARTLVAASRYSGDWGRAFHVPSQHISIRDLASRFATYCETNLPDLRAFTETELIAMARDDAFMREVAEMAYLYQKPCLIDDEDTQRLLGVSGSSLDTIITDTLRMVD